MLFGQIYTPPVRILIHGDLGVGKSTLLRQIASDWGKGITFYQRQRSQSPSDNEDPRDGLNMFDIVLPLDLRLLHEDSTDVTPQDVLHKIVTKQLVFLSSKDRSFVIDYIFKYPERVLFLLDDADNCQSKTMYKIIEGSVLEKCVCVITSQNAFLHCEHDLFCLWKYQLKGFSRHQATAFVKNAVESLGSENIGDAVLNTLLNKLDLEVKETDLKDDELAPNLTRYPPLLHTMVILWENRKPIPTSWKDCVEAILNQILASHQKENDELEAYEDILVKYGPQLRELGHIAFDIVVGNRGQLAFTRSFLQEKYNLSTKSWELGILVGPGGKISTEKDTHVVWSTKYLVDYLAAYYLTNNADAETVKEFMSSCTDMNVVFRRKQIFSTVCGMSAECGNRLLQDCVHIYNETWVENKKQANVLDLMLSCLDEYKDIQNAKFTLPTKLVFTVNEDNVKKLETLVSKHTKEQNVTELSLVLHPKMELTNKMVVSLINPLVSGKLLHLKIDCGCSMTHEAYKQLNKEVKLMKKLNSFNLTLHRPHKKERYFKSLLDNLSHLPFLTNVNINITESKEA